METPNTKTQTPKGAPARLETATWPLFKHLSDTYQLTLVEDELQQIIAKADECRVSQNGAAAMSDQLRDNLKVMKRLIGDGWEASAAEYRMIVRRVMLATDDANPIACALPMAKEMSKRGHSPLMLLAVATEMSQASNDQAHRPPT